VGTALRGFLLRFVGFQQSHDIADLPEPIVSGAWSCQQHLGHVFAGFGINYDELDPLSSPSLQFLNGVEP
jgi:hypothetical protein